MSKEDTRGVGIMYPARTGTRKLAEELANEGYIQKDDLVNDGITFNIEEDKLTKDDGFKEDSMKNNFVKEVFDEMMKDEDLVNEINEIVKEQEEEILGDIIKEVSGILKTVNGDVKMSDEQKVGIIGEAQRKTTYEIAAQLIKDRQLAGGRMGVNDDLCNTNLISKNYSPMFIRKFNASQLCNWPLYVSMICDEDVSDIDQVVNGALKAYDAAGLMGNNLQNMRNLTGIISESMSIHYNNKKENCVEGIAVTLYIDKAYIQSFTGDFMNHAQCRQEYTAALNMMTQI